MSNALIIETIKNVLVVRFNRPEIRSPLSIAVLDELHGVLNGKEAIDANGIVFTGIGDVFASGADLREIAEVNGSTAPEFARRGQRLFGLIAERATTTIAAVNGFCFGGALDLALACGRRIASPTALFSHPGANLGIITGWGGTQRLPRLIGEANAIEMLFMAKRVTAPEALAIGLVDAIAADPLKAAVDLAGTDQ